MKRHKTEVTFSADPEGDSTMHSSPELEADNDEMFPDEAIGPSTPRNPPTFALDPSGPSDLSPPNSQGPSLLANRDENLSTALGRSTSTSINANGKRVRTSVMNATATVPSTEGSQVDSETGYTWTKQEEQPGWDWKNTRAREDESRAWEHIVDKSSMIKSRPLDTYTGLPANKGSQIRRPTRPLCADEEAMKGAALALTTKSTESQGRLKQCGEGRERIALGGVFHKATEHAPTTGGTAMCVICVHVPP
jgi:hypothetical protein